MAGGPGRVAAVRMSLSLCSVGVTRARRPRHTGKTDIIASLTTQKATRHTSNHGRHHADSGNSGARDSRFSRQSHSRGGSHPGGRNPRTRSRPERSLHRRARSRRAARRRQAALPGQGRAQGGRECERRNRRRPGQPGRLRPARPRSEDDRTRWHREQGPPGSQCHPGGFDGGSAGFSRRFQPAALPLSRRSRRQHSAHPDDEHPQRRRARRQQRGLSGIHGDAGRRGIFLGSAALGRRGIPHSERRAQKARLQHRGRRRRRLRAVGEVECRRH